jgi:hypothetical protein
LLDKTITLRAREIAGARPFACTAPHFKISDFTADMIFQGAFETMQSNNKSVDPNKLAASLGFLGKSIKTLETGCEIDFHFVDATTAEVGLNDYVYTLKKQQPPLCFGVPLAMRPTPPALRDGREAQALLRLQKAAVRAARRAAQERRGSAVRRI